MCRYNMASQQNSMTQSIYLRGSTEPYITWYYKHGSHDPTYKVIQATSESITCLSTDNYKRRRLRSLTIYKTLHRNQTSVWDSQANRRSPRETTSETEVSLQNIDKQPWVQRYSARLTSELTTYAPVSTKGWWSLTASSDLWLSGYPVLQLLVTSLRWESGHESTYSP
jgi:hypothetical protein